MTDNDLKNIVSKYKTPLFLFDTDEVRDRAAKIKHLLNEPRVEKEGISSPGIGLCFSIKANPFLIPALMDTVDKFEVCSPGELAICKHYRVPGEQIIYSGVHKELSDITEAVEYGASVLTAESRRHYELISQAARGRKKPVDVILRLSAGSQFGMSPEDIGKILKDYVKGKNAGGGPGNEYPDNVNICGLHYFAGTGRTKLKHQKKELSELSDYLRTLRDTYSVLLPGLEYGPGLGYPYFTGEDFSDTLLPLKELLPDLSEISGLCELTVEMGRFIASGCGCYLTEVVDTKQSFNRNWCILDGGINHVNYLGQMMGMKVPVIKHIRGQSKDSCQGADCADPSTAEDGNKIQRKDPAGAYEVRELKEWALCGSLCTTNDVLVRSIEMEEPKPGDILVFCNIGAYSVTEAMLLFLSRDMPKIVMYSKGSGELARDTVETWQLNCSL